MVATAFMHCDNTGVQNAVFLHFLAAFLASATVPFKAYAAAKTFAAPALTEAAPAGDDV